MQQYFGKIVANLLSFHANGRQDNTFCYFQWHFQEASPLHIFQFTLDHCQSNSDWITSPDLPPDLSTDMESSGQDRPEDKSINHSLFILKVKVNSPYLGCGERRGWKWECKWGPPLLQVLAAKEWEMGIYKKKLKTVEKTFTWIWSFL